MDRVWQQGPREEAVAAVQAEGEEAWEPPRAASQGQTEGSGEENI